MATTHSKPYGWIENIHASLVALEERPQFPLAPFPWDEFQLKLTEIFEQEVKLLHREKGWSESSQLLTGFSTNIVPLSIHVNLFKTPLYIIMNEANIKGLMASLLGGDEEAAFFLEESYFLGFYHYFISEIVRACSQLPFLKGIDLTLGEEVSKEALLQAPCFVVDLTLNLGEKSVRSRLLIPDTFRVEWKKHVAITPSEKNYSQVPIDLSVEVGNVTLNLEEWKEVKSGDWILLDRCSFDPETKKGRFILTLNNQPLFRAKLASNGIELLEYPLYEESAAPMDEEDEFDFDEEDDDLFDDDEEDEEDEEDEDFEEELPDVEEKAPKKEPPPPPIKKKVVSEERQSISPGGVPIELTVEVGRIKMTGDELLKLSPGSLLELDVAPEQGVDLVIGGKRVGKGELLKVGEALGVRIVQL